MKKGYKFSKTLTFAYKGLKHCLQYERNMRIHLLAAVIAVALGFLKGIGHLEWGLLAITISLVLILEMVNTALENIVDLITLDYHPLAKIAKNVAAGAVLVAALNALVIGVIIFLK